MLGALQKRKLAHLFNLYDANQDGVLQRSDYVQISRNLANIHGVPLDSADYTKLETEHLAIWAFVKSMADANQDDQVTLEEFQAGWDGLISQPEMFTQLIDGYADTQIAMEDRDGDGGLTADEYAKALGGYNISDADGREAFRRLDRNGDGFLTRDEIVKNVNEFFKSDDPQAPGNWLMGPY